MGIAGLSLGIAELSLGIAELSKGHPAGKKTSLDLQHIFTKDFSERYLKWRNPKTYISYMDTAYVRENPPPRQP